MRRMGCLQLKRWLSFLPAAFVVYILLHYFVYQPDIQETHTTFLGSSSSRIVKLSASDIGIKETVHHPYGELPSEVTYSSDVRLPTNNFPSNFKEESNESRDGLEHNKIANMPLSNHLSSQEVPSSEQYIAQTTVNVGPDNRPSGVDYKPSRDDILLNELNSIPRANKDYSLFLHNSTMDEHIVKSLQLKRAMELKSMEVQRHESKVAKHFTEDSGNNMESVMEVSFGKSNMDAKKFSNVVNKDAASYTVYGANELLPAKLPGSDLSSNYVNAASELKPDTNVVVNLIEGPIEQRLNEGFQNVNSYDPSADVSNHDSKGEAKVENMRGEADVNREELPSDQDSIIVPRELLSREDNGKKKNDEISSSIEEKEKMTSAYEIRKGVTDGGGVSSATNFNSSQLAEGSGAASLNEKPQLPKNVEESNNIVKLVPQLKSNSSSETPSQRDSSKQKERAAPKSESIPVPTASNTPVQSKGSSVKHNPKVTTVIKPKNEIHQQKQQKVSTGYAISALNGPISVGQRYEKGFATAHEDLCQSNGRDLKVLILITSAPDHEKHRNAVRQTWGHFSMRRDIVMAFVVGRTARTDVQNVIDKENDRYGDIIEANFVDHYSNLTLKTVSMFEWAKTYCSEARFVLKTDDDMYINVPLLLAFITAKNGERRAMFGRLAKGWKPVRNTKSKYYIDTATYSRVRYPDFLTGPAYLFTNDVVEEIYQKVLNTTFFVLEDVLITGIVGESLGVKRVGDSHFRNEKIKLADTCKLMQSISIHMVKYEEQFDIYKRTLDGKTKCKTK